MSHHDLLHNDHRIRLQAIEHVATTLKDKPQPLLTLLLHNLADAHPTPRQRAALVLGEAATKHPHVLQALHDLLAPTCTDPQDLQRQQSALRALEHTATLSLDLDADLWPSLRQHTLRLCTHPSPDMRFQALRALAHQQADTPEHRQQLRASLTDEQDGEVAAEILDLLAQWGDAQALPQMMDLWPRLQERPRQRGLLATARLLATQNLHTPARQQVIDALLEETRALPFGLEACQWLGVLGQGSTDGSDKILSTLRAMAQSWLTHRFLKVAAASALADIGDPQGSTLLGKHMHARRRDMSGYAMERIGALGLTEHTPALLVILNNPKHYHADTAALALGLIATLEATEALTAAARDPRPEVRLEVARALRRSPRDLQPAQQALQHLTQDPDEEVRLMALGLSTESHIL